MDTYISNDSVRTQRRHTKTHILICTHLTLIETRGWQLSPLTGSIRGQSAAEPHAAQQQRDTLDYRETAQAHNGGGVEGVGVAAGGAVWTRGAE